MGGGEGMVSGSRMSLFKVESPQLLFGKNIWFSLFKRLSKCGGGSLAACGTTNLQATAPGDLAGSRWHLSSSLLYCILLVLQLKWVFINLYERFIFLVDGPLIILSMTNDNNNNKCIILSRTNDSPHPFPGLRPVNRLRSKSSILQVSHLSIFSLYGHTSVCGGPPLEVYYLQPITTI